MLAQIEKDFFGEADLVSASLLKDDERRDYRLAQVERLLSDMRIGGPLAMYLSDMFWTADEGRIPMPWENTPPIPQPGYLTNPLLSLKGQQTLTDEEMGRLRLILEIAGLCHDLSLHFTFDLNEAFGIKFKNPYGLKTGFEANNKPLIEWLTTTPYEQIAMHTAYIMKKVAIGVYEYGHYQPAQDELAELFSSEYGELIREPDYIKDIPARTYVQIIIDALLRIEKHWQRGLKRKLKPDVIMLHDEIYGLIPLRFDKGVLQAAQELFDYMDQNVKGRLVLKDYNYHAASWEDQPESVKRITTDVLNRFAEKVRQVRDKYLADGWIADDSLEFAYLMAHAENCGYGFWREEEQAL